MAGGGGHREILVGTRLAGDDDLAVLRGDARRRIGVEERRVVVIDDVLDGLADQPGAGLVDHDVTTDEVLDEDAVGRAVEDRAQQAMGLGRMLLRALAVVGRRLQGGEQVGDLARARSRQRHALAPDDGGGGRRQRHERIGDAATDHERGAERQHDRKHAGGGDQEQGASQRRLDGVERHADGDDPSRQARARKASVEALPVRRADLRDPGGLPRHGVQDRRGRVPAEARAVDVGRGEDMALAVVDGRGPAWWEGVLGDQAADAPPRDARDQERRGATGPEDRRSHTNQQVPLRPGVSPLADERVAVFQHIANQLRPGQWRQRLAGGNEHVHELPAARVGEEDVLEAAVREHDGGRLGPEALEVASVQALRRRERLERADPAVDLAVDRRAERLGGLLQSVLELRPLLRVPAEHEPHREREHGRERDEDEHDEVPSQRGETGHLGQSIQGVVSTGISECDGGGKTFPTP